MNMVEKNRAKNRAYIEELKSMTDEELCKKFNCTPEQICRGNYEAKYTNDEVCPYVVVLGFVNAAASNLKSLGDLKFVGVGDFGDGLYNQGLVLSNSEIKDLGKVKRIYGSLMLDAKTKYVTSFGELEYIGDSCYLNRTLIKDMGKVKEIGGILSIDNSNITSLEGLEKVGKIFAYEGYSLKDWGNTLKEVGDVEFGFQPIAYTKSGSAQSLRIHSVFHDKFKRNSSGKFERIEAKKEESLDI
ncbi:MAG: hypothetical protein IKA36_04870 [Clostridia bacterium]|nr:hypothetical protein [Clostridia bacterium]